MAPIIKKTWKVLVVIVVIVLFAVIALLANEGDIKERARMSPTEAWVEVGKYLSLSLSVCIMVVGVAKLVLSQKIKFACLERFEKIEEKNKENTDKFQTIIKENQANQTSILLIQKDISSLRDQFGEIKKGFKEDFEKLFSKINNKETKK